MTTTGVRPRQQAPRQRRQSSRRPRRGGPGRFDGGSPLVYAVALVVVAITLGPVVYAVLGGFRTNDQLASAPNGVAESERILLAREARGTGRRQILRQQLEVRGLVAVAQGRIELELADERRFRNGTVFLHYRTRT